MVSLYYYNQFLPTCPDHKKLRQDHSFRKQRPPPYIYTERRQTLYFHKKTSILPWINRLAFDLWNTSLNNGF